MVPAQKPLVILSLSKDLGIAAKREHAASVLLLCQDFSTPLRMTNLEKLLTPNSSLLTADFIPTKTAAL